MRINEALEWLNDAAKLQPLTEPLQIVRTRLEELETVSIERGVDFTDADVEGFVNNTILAYFLLRIGEIEDA